MTTATSILLDNPFATRATRSGTIPFCFEGQESLEGLLDRLRHYGWRGQIVGPHGSGKSTLLASLAEAICRLGRRTKIVRMFQGRGALPAELRSKVARSGVRDDGLVYLIDGFEQLATARRWWIQHCLRQHALVVTTHQPVHGLAIVYQTSVTDEIAWEVVSRLTSTRGPIVSRERVATLLAKNGGNLRETLFALYDWYESNRETYAQLATTNLGSLIA
jgi:hypothetical protein